jgi:RNA polymerase sigma-70 factor (ECF subfamily)
VRNQCLNVMRDRKIDERARQFLMLESEVSTRDVEDLETEISTLHQGVADLEPPACREVILLHYRDGLTFREIAERLNVSETTVYKHLRCALDQLRLTITPLER